MRFDIHVHFDGLTVVVQQPPAGSSPSRDTRLVLAMLGTLGARMTRISDGLAELKAADDALASEVNELFEHIDGEAERTAAAVKSALEAVGADDDEVAAEIEAAKNATQAIVDAIKAKLAPQAAPEEPAPEPAPEG
jgi:predicted transcriptional regulator